MSRQIKPAGHRAKRERYYAEVIRYHYQDGLSDRKISKIIPVHRTTITRWILNFALENNLSRYSSYEMVKSKLPQQASVVNLTDAEIKSLQEENLKLRRQLQEAELRADLYNEIINVAEKQFNISIWVYMSIF